MDIDKRNKNHPIFDSDDYNVTLANDNEVCAMSDFVDKLENKMGKDDVKCFVK